MFSKRKSLGKILSAFLAILLWINPFLVPITWAEETPPEEQQAEVTPTPEPQSTITTGDANATTEVETTANTHQDTIPGEITTPPGDCTPPEGETTCSEDVAINNSNSATVSDSVDSTGNTGENQIVGSEGNASITTGDATASGDIENNVNYNSVTLEATPTETLGLTPTPSCDLVGSSAPSEEKTLTVTNENEGTVENEAQVSAETGENLASENLGDVQIETGNALAIANLLNLLNTNVVGSNFEILFLNILNGSGEDIDLNELWRQIQEKGGIDSLTINGETSGLEISVVNSNQASLENNVDVSAGTGENKANENEGDVSVKTGEATAVANVANVVNTNILGSKFLFCVINIIDPDTGNLILPRRERFSSETNSLDGGGEVVFENQNQAETEDSVVAVADTGENEQNNNAQGSTLTSGNATAVANSFSILNLNIFRNNWFFLVINNLGKWQGKILGWANPSAEEEPGEGTQIHQEGLAESQQEEGVGESGSNSPPLSFQNQNEAKIKNNITTSASTGGNQASENNSNTEIETGNAYSLANLFNFVNLNILGGRWFLGLVNIVGGWSGNTVYAYPDVAVDLLAGKSQVMPGETFEYTVTYKNLGYDEAQEARLNLELPEGLIYLEDGSGITPSVSGRNISWNLGTLKSKDEGNFIVRVMVSSDFNFEQSLTWLSRFIPQAHASENEKEKDIVASGNISTADPESNSNNNSSSVITIVYLPQSSTEVDNRHPVLEITAKNNVVDFVYPGDTVSFEVTVKNTSDVPSYNTRFIQRLYNGVPEDFGIVEIELGTIEPGKSGRLTFGLKLANDGVLPEGAYRTIATATGNAPNGDLVTSNEARTDFNIKSSIVSTLFETKAAGKEEEVLGTATESSCPKDEDILPYVLLLLLSSLYISSWAKPKLKKLKK